MKRCLYCLREHGRRARCCSDWCERHVRGKVAYCTRARRQSVARILTAIQAREKHRRRWRDVSMGRAQVDHLLTIFGTLPSDAPPSCDFGDD